jgi:uncharacterized protein YndB with AHSA1/START domain
MENKENITITVQTSIAALVEKVWDYWTLPAHIIQWNAASDDWHTPHAENDLRVGGKFLSRMEARDGSVGFDFEGTYETVIKHVLIVYSLADGRKVKIYFAGEGSETNIVETFDAETTHTVDQQRAGWQAILNNFKSYTEKHK